MNKRNDGPSKGLPEKYSGARPDHPMSRRLLLDVNHVFGRSGLETLSQEQLVDALRGLSVSPWADYDGGAGLSKHSLSRMLEAFLVKPLETQADDGAASVVIGYHIRDLVPAFRQILEGVRVNLITKYYGGESHGDELPF